jgi:predicted Zn-dependent protease
MSLDPNLIYQIGQKILQKNSFFDEIHLRAIHENRRQIQLRQGKLNQHDLKIDQGMMIEFIKDSQHAYLASGLIDDVTAVQMMERACQKWDQWKPFLMSVPTKTGKNKNATSITEDFFREDNPFHISMKDLLAKLTELNNCMQISPLIAQRTIWSFIIDHDQVYWNSLGALIHRRRPQLINSFEVTAHRGVQTQTRSDGGVFQRSRQDTAAFFFREQTLPQRLTELAEQACRLLDAEECPQETTKLLLSPDQMALQIHETVGHPLEMDRILGDERNFAGSSFVQLEDFGKLIYGSPLMNIRFSPHKKNDLSSYFYDDCGQESASIPLIQNGLLIQGLSGRDSQARTGKPGVANSRAQSWNRPAIDRMANVNLEAGDTNLKDLISGIEKGVLMETCRSWSIDDFRNKFQFGCEIAYRIQDGQIGEMLRNPNYRGQTLNFWKSLKGLSRETQSIGLPFCGKGEPNQVAFVNHASPFALFDHVEIFGA